MASVKDIAEIVTLISAAYPNWQPNPYTTEVYYQTLKDMDAELLKTAALQAIAEPGRKFAPSVGEIRGAAGDLRKEASGLPSSYQAWQEVCTQMSVNGGDYGKPVWSHPLVEQAVKTLGWRNLRMSEDQTADRARFISAYEQLTNRASAEDMRLPVAQTYIESHRALALETGERRETMRQLAEGMRK